MPIGTDHLLPTTYDPLLVALSILIAIAASFTALELTARVSIATGRARLAWLAAGSVAMGVGIWAMHFTGMLAYRTPLPMAFDPWLTAASLAVAIAASGLALAVGSRPHLGPGALAAGGVLMGFAIAGMHYLGMAAIVMDAVAIWQPAAVVLSILIAVGAGAAGLYLAFQLRADEARGWVGRRLMAAVVLGVAIAGMHSTGMAAVRFQATDVTMAPMSAALQVSEVDGLIVAISALLLLGMGLLGSVRDLMAERQRVLEEARLRLAAIVESSTDAILSVDEAGRITSWNFAAERMFGWSAAEMLGRTGLEIVPKSAMAARNAQLAQTLAGGYVVEHETERRRRDGTLLHVAVSMAPLRDVDGRIVGASLIARDIGARKRAEVELAARTAELERANQRLVAADLHKDEFLSVISHELRTPLNFITGFASVLEDGLGGPLNPDQARYVGKILEGSDVMLHLVNDLLDVAKIQAGKLTLDVEPADVEALVEGVVARLQPLAARKGLLLTATVDVAGQPTLDAMRIGQVLTNLVGNAIKFTERGEVQIRVDGRPGDALRFQIRDSGHGIGEDDILRLFTRFQQVDMSATRRAGGTGLGLSISKAIVEGHGGEIGVLSEPGLGSTFWFWLPERSLAVTPG